MKNYLKNKNFIPRGYVNNIEKRKNKGNKRGLIYLIIINLLILPITIEGILKKEKQVEPEIPIFSEEVYRESIISWINELDDDVVGVNVENSNAKMTVKSAEKIYELEEKGDIYINNISKNEKGYYILEITRNDK